MAPALFTCSELPGAGGAGGHHPRDFPVIGPEAVSWAQGVSSARLRGLRGLPAARAPPERFCHSRADGWRRSSRSSWPAACWAFMDESATCRARPPLYSPVPGLCLSLGHWPRAGRL